MSDRPDPITPKVTGWALIATVVAAFAAALIDLGWEAPLGNNVMDWVRSLLPIILGVAAGKYASTQAKKETTPVEDPRTSNGVPLVPETTLPASGAGAGPIL